MPRGRNTTAPPSSTFNGWYRDGVNNVLEWYHNGTKIGQASGATVTMAGALSATTTVTGTTGVVATTGNVTATAGDVNATAGNFRAGAINTFGTTEPTSAIVFKQGTAFAGAITTSCGLQASATVLRKIIADGTVSNVET